MIVIQAGVRALLVVLAAMGSIGCVQALDPPLPGTPASVVETRLGPPSDVLTEVEEIQQALERLRECSVDDTSATEMLWLYERHNHKVLAVALDMDGSVACAENHGTVVFIQ